MCDYRRIQCANRSMLVHSWALGLLVVLAVGCGDDDSPGDQEHAGAAATEQSGGAGGAGTGGSGGHSGVGGTGGIGGTAAMQSPGTSPYHPCDPADHAGDPCLACLTRYCCYELGPCGSGFEMGATPTPYVWYNTFFQCVQDCFGSGDDGGGVDASEERLIACGSQCDLIHDLDYRRRDLLACASGGVRPYVFRDDAGVGQWAEGDPTIDASVADQTCSGPAITMSRPPIHDEGCAAECFPSWEP